MTFPNKRPRRLRKNSKIRSLVASNSLRVEGLVQPIFIREGINEPQKIESMPGIFAYPLEDLCSAVEMCLKKGIGTVALFATPEKKDSFGSEATNEEGILNKSVKLVKDKFQEDIVVLADLCLDEFTSHGHCGITRDGSSKIDNDLTLVRYAETAKCLGRSGADFVAPSGMMDGQVGVVRAALDEEGLIDCGIFAYSVKFASSLYGPFREAVSVDLKGGNRSTYQQDFRRSWHESLDEVYEDVAQGADIVMVKPASTNLDLVARIREKVNVPLACYQVSGEYSMIVAASEKGWIDREGVIIESVHSIFRAGADIVVTYFASDIAEGLNG